MSSSLRAAALLTSVLVLTACSSDGDPEHLRSLATDYLDAVVAGDTDKAWNLACLAEHGRGPQSDWSPIADKPVASYTITDAGIYPQGSKAPSKRVVTVAITHSGDAAGTAPAVRQLDITQESGEWKVCPREPL